MKIRHAVLCLLLASTSLQAADTPKRVIVCTTTLGFRHDSIPFAEEALADLDKASPEFEIVEWIRQPDIEVPKPPPAPRKPAANASQADVDEYRQALTRHQQEKKTWNREVKPEADRKRSELAEALKEALAPLSPQALRDNRIDAVVFCNTSGELPLPDLDGFADWVRSGGAFLGIHAASDTLKDALPYTELLCGVFDGHGPQVSATLHAGDKDHPANGGIGDIWTLAQEEMYLIKKHDRDLVRSIWFMRHHPNKPEEKGFFPVAWVRSFGNGRVFYTSLGHREDMWSIDPDLPNRINPVETAQQFRKHLLGGLRWAAGLENSPAEPNPQTN